MTAKGEPFPVLTSSALDKSSRAAMLACNAAAPKLQSAAFRD
jgi:hypothetical protein